MFDMSPYTVGMYTGEIYIWHSGADSLNTVPCELYVNGQPSTGAVISAERSSYNLIIEPDVTGELKIRIYNQGDQPLMILGSANSHPWLYPVSDTGTVNTIEPFDLAFQINTTGYQDIVLSDVINIFSNSANEPTLPINIELTVTPDLVTGSYPLGDVNYDGWCNWADVEYLRDYIFGIGPAPCMPAGDINDDGIINIMDVVQLIAYVSGTGSPPANACPISDNPPEHNINLQTQVEQYISAHRGEWIDVPLYVQNGSYFRGQTSFDIQAGIVDEVIAEDITGLGYEAIGVIETNITRDIDIVNISDTLGPGTPVNFSSLTQLYNLQMHIKADAPIGRYQLLPSTSDASRGPTLYYDTDNYTSKAPMFAGANINIKPRVSLDEIVGLPEIGLVDQLRNFSLSLAITSDADVSNQMQLFIIQVSSGDTVFADIVDQVLSIGSHVYNFPTDWEINTPGFYLVGAQIATDLDEAADNTIRQVIYLTDNIQNGLPPAEGFGGDGIINFKYHDNRNLIVDLPSNYTSENEDNESPEWDTYTGMSYDMDNNKCAHMPGYDWLGPHNDWLVYGPMTGVNLESPVIRFWETAFNWNDTSGSTHEFYIQYSDDFDVSNALTNGPILVHTPDNHGIAPSVWLSVSINLPDSISVDDKVYFAWRYSGNREEQKNKFDIWRVDYIEWFEGAGDEYEYLPGDANMAVGLWPPEVIGGDVTYLVNYYRGMSDPCMLGGLLESFYAAGDANGDCQTIGGDVTWLVNYFRGLGNLGYCIDYMPAWPTPGELPAEMPTGWPNCETFYSTDNNARELNDFGKRSGSK
jgi:hypothetical protein